MADDGGDTDGADGHAIGGARGRLSNAQRHNPRAVTDLVALAKKRFAEGKPLTYGSGGVGAFHHRCAGLFSILTGIKMSHVPCRGSAPSTMALISGQIDVLCPHH